MAAKKVMMPCAAKDQVKPLAACQGAMKNCFSLAGMKKISRNGFERILEKEKEGGDWDRSEERKY